MTPEQQANYERARSEAEAVHQRLTMETNAVITRSRAPIEPAPALSLWQRIVRRTADYITAIREAA